MYSNVPLSTERDLRARAVGRRLMASEREGRGQGTIVAPHDCERGKNIKNTVSSLRPQPEWGETGEEATRRWGQEYNGTEACIMHYPAPQSHLGLIFRSYNEVLDSSASFY